jgi:hypothetical protein
VKVDTDGFHRKDDPEKISFDYEAQKALAKRIYYSGKIMEKGKQAV